MCQAKHRIQVCIGLCLSGLNCSRYSRSSRLASRAPRQPQCNAGLLPRFAGIVIYNSRMDECRQSQGIVSSAPWLLGLVLVAACGSACSMAPLDVESTLAVTDVTTGWLDVGLDELGRTKLVPTVSFRLENVSEDGVRTLQLNGVFRRCMQAPAGQPMPVSEVSPANELAGTCAGEIQEWGSAFVRAVGREGLDPGMAAGPFTMESGLGYTGEQSRIEMLQHRDFVDVKLELFVKHRADPWVRLSEHLIDRQLLIQ